MAYPVPVGSVLLLTFEGRMLNQQVMNTTAWYMNPGATLPDGRLAAQALVNHVQTVNELYDLWLQCLSSQVTQCQITAQWVYPTRFGAVKSAGAPASGAVGGEPMGPNAAVAITRRTGLAGRKQQSDLHMFGVPMSFSTQGKVNTTGVTAYDAFGVAATSPITVATPSFTLQPVPWSKAAPANVSRYIAHQTQRDLRTMHRRTVGLGS